MYEKHLCVDMPGYVDTLTCFITVKSRYFIRFLTLCPAQIELQYFIKLMSLL